MKLNNKDWVYYIVLMEMETVSVGSVRAKFSKRFFEMISPSQ